MGEKNRIYFLKKTSSVEFWTKLKLSLSKHNFVCGTESTASSKSLPRTGHNFDAGEKLKMLFRPGRSTMGWL